MMRLYSYTVRVDDGAAPNPYGGVCTLAICKPGIRLNAEPGDWILGLGPKNAPDGRDLSSHVIYAMLVSHKMTYERYNVYCQQHLLAKLPLWFESEPFEHQVGDCLYFPPWHDGALQQRRGVHNKGDIPTDMRGENVLLATEVFYYFGDQAIELPSHFYRIRHPNQGFKCPANESVKDDVVAWIKGGFGQNRRARVLYGQPLHRAAIRPRSDDETSSSCRHPRGDNDEDGDSVC